MRSKCAPAMEEVKRHSVKRGWVTLWSIGLLVLVYFLSMGPAYRLFRKDAVKQETFSTVYAPILYLCNHCSPFDRAIDWYLEFWYSDAREMFRQAQQWT